MASLAELTTILRRRINDATSPVYIDDYYTDALTFALKKLNFDWSTTYTNVDEVVGNDYFLLIKLATIELCYIRATEEPVNGESNITQVQVPDLTVQSKAESPSKIWLDLAKKIQSEYDGELKNGAGSGATSEIQESHFYRQSLRTNGTKPYELATKLTVPTITVSVSGSDVTISWTPIYTTFFSAYEIWRDTTSDMSNAVKVQELIDNHDEEWTDENLASDTYYYRMDIINTDNLTTTGSIVTAIVT